MSVHASPERAATGLDAIVRRAGGVLARRRGAPLIVNYGSAAGELAACVCAVGMADRSPLTKLELAGPADELRAVVTAATGATVAPGGALFAGEAWWCAAGSERVIALAEPWCGERLLAAVQRVVASRPAVWLSDRSSEWSAISVVGRWTGEVLGALGVYGPSGDPRQTPPFGPGTAGPAAALWLLESDRRALALVARRQAGLAWQAIERAGQASGIRYVGQDAVARYALLDRRVGA